MKLQATLNKAGRILSMFPLSEIESEGEEHESMKVEHVMPKLDQWEEEDFIVETVEIEEKMYNETVVEGL